MKNLKMKNLKDIYNKYDKIVKTIDGCRDLIDFINSNCEEIANLFRLYSDLNCSRGKWNYIGVDLDGFNEKGFIVNFEDHYDGEINSIFIDKKYLTMNIEDIENELKKEKEKRTLEKENKRKEEKLNKEYEIYLKLKEKFGK